MIEITLANETVTFADNEPVTATIHWELPRSVVQTASGTNYVLRWFWQQKTIVLKCTPQDATTLEKFEKIVDGSVQTIRIDQQLYDVVRSANVTRRRWSGADDVADTREVVLYVA